MSNYHENVTNWLNTFSSGGENDIEIIEINSSSDSTASSTPLPTVEDLLSMANSSSAGIEIDSHSTASSTPLPTVEELLSMANRGDNSNRIDSHSTTSSESLPTLAELLSNHPRRSPPPVINNSPPEEDIELISLDGDENDPICPICLGHFHERVTLPCQHELHTVCYSNLLASGVDRCPMCRRDKI